MSFPINFALSVLSHYFSLSSYLSAWILFSNMPLKLKQFWVVNHLHKNVGQPGLLTVLLATTASLPSHGNTHFGSTDFRKLSIHSALPSSRLYSSIFYSASIIAAIQHRFYNYILNKLMNCPKPTKRYLVNTFLKLTYNISKAFYCPI